MSLTHGLVLLLIVFFLINTVSSRNNSFTVRDCPPHGDTFIRFIDRDQIVALSQVSYMEEISKRNDKSSISAISVVHDNGMTYVLGVYQRSRGIVIDGHESLDAAPIDKCFLTAYNETNDIVWTKMILPSKMSFWGCTDIVLLRTKSDETELLIFSDFIGSAELKFANQSIKHFSDFLQLIIIINPEDGSELNLFQMKETEQANIMISDQFSLYMYITIEGNRHSIRRVDFFHNFLVEQMWGIDQQNIILTMHIFKFYLIFLEVNHQYHDGIQVNMKCINKENGIHVSCGNEYTFYFSKVRPQIQGLTDKVNYGIEVKNTPEEDGIAIIGTAMGPHFAVTKNQNETLFQKSDLDSDELFAFMIKFKTRENNENGFDIVWIKIPPLDAERDHILHERYIGYFSYAYIVNVNNSMHQYLLDQNGTLILHHQVPEASMNSYLLTEDRQSVIVTGSFKKPNFHETAKSYPKEAQYQGFAVKYHLGCNCNITKCIVPKCNDLYNFACSGNGKCVGKNQCKCIEMYSGDACQFPTCNGIPQHDPKTCNGRGRCIRPDTCDCEFSAGQFCEITRCHGLTDEDACSGNGICEPQNYCRCHNGFTGVECQVNELSVLQQLECNEMFEIKKRNITLKVGTKPLKIPIKERDISDLYSIFLHSMKMEIDKNNNGETLVYLPLCKIEDYNFFVVLAKSNTVVKKVSNNDGHVECINSLIAVAENQFTNNDIVMTGFSETLSGISLLKVYRPGKNNFTWSTIIGGEVNDLVAYRWGGGHFFIGGRYFDINIGNCVAKHRWGEGYFILGSDLHGNCTYLEAGLSGDVLSLFSNFDNHLFVGGDFSKILILNEKYKLTLPERRISGFIAKYITKQSSMPKIEWYGILHHDHYVTHTQDITNDKMGNVYDASLLYSEEFKHIRLQVRKSDSQAYERWRFVVDMNVTHETHAIRSVKWIKLSAVSKDGSILSTGCLHGTNIHFTTIYEDKWDKEHNIHLPDVFSPDEEENEFFCKFFLLKLDFYGNLSWIIVDDPTTNSFSRGYDVKILDDLSIGVFMYHTKNSSWILYKPDEFQDGKLMEEIQLNSSYEWEGSLVFIQLSEYLCQTCLPNQKFVTNNKTCVECPPCQYGNGKQCDQCGMTCNLLQRIYHQSLFTRDERSCIHFSNLSYILFAITGSILLSFALLILVLSMLCVPLIVKDYRKSKKTLEQYKVLNEGVDDRFSDICIDLFSVKYSDLKISKEIHIGGSGTIIYKGTWKNRVVAIKAFRTSAFSGKEHFEDFEHELKIFFSLRHRNVVTFYGAFLNPPIVGLVLEYVRRGSLEAVLKNEDLDMQKRISILLDISRGMYFLHNKNIIHRDLKCDNVLVDEDYCAKVTDFGISRPKLKGNQILTQNVGTNVFMAPEVSLGRDYDEKCDVFSFGILMYQVLTNVEPYSDPKTGKRQNFNFIIEQRVAIDANFRPQIDEIMKLNLNPSLLTLMQKCWSHDPGKRPSFDNIEQILLHELEPTDAPFLSLKRSIELENVSLK